MNNHPQDLLFADPSTVKTVDLLNLILNYDGETNEKARREWHSRARVLDKLREEIHEDLDCENVEGEAQRLHEAWMKYTEFFGEPPHGTVAQLRGLLSLLPAHKNPQANLSQPGDHTSSGG